MKSRINRRSEERQYSKVFLDIEEGVIAGGPNVHQGIFDDGVIRAVHSQATPTRNHQIELIFVVGCLHILGTGG